MAPLLACLEILHRWIATSRTQPEGQHEGGAARYGATYGRASPPRKQAERSNLWRLGRRERRSRTPRLSPALPSRWPAKTAAKRELAQNARFELYSGTPANLNKIADRPSGRRANAMKTLAFLSRRFEKTKARSWRF